MKTGQKATSCCRGTLLSRLARDTTGNVMFMTAAAIIPIAGLTGGAVDLSRAYLVKARMQQACDAGALAGRRSMSGVTITETDKLEAFRLFFFNFPNGTMDAQPLSSTNPSAPNRVTVSLTADQQLQMNATTAMPTTLLRLVGQSEIRVDVQCKAEEYYVNTDVMLVLDTTGSMNCTIGSDDSCAATSEQSNSKMLNMRNAVKQLFNDLIPARNALTAKNLRLRMGLVQYSQNVNVGKLLYAENTSYIRNPYPYYNSSGTLKSAYDHPASWFTSTWNGCIEERATVSTITSTTTTIPSAAYDLDMVTMPTSDATRWAPADPAQEESEGSSGTANACPKPAKLLQEWPDQAVFNAHVDTLTTGIGRTHHDTGIIWGTRMIAPVGVFGSHNPTTYNTVKVAKTIVFMTDGILDIARDYYTAYGVPRSAGRTAAKSATDTTLEAIHENRFSLMCTRAKEMGIDIWVVALLTTTPISSSMQNCASNSAQAIKVSNAAQLSAAFRRISDKVGNLRIGQ